MSCFILKFPRKADHCLVWVIRSYCWDWSLLCLDLILDTWFTMKIVMFHLRFDLLMKIQVLLVLGLVLVIIHLSFRFSLKLVTKGSFIAGWLSNEFWMKNYIYC
jgi:hypothetical protein